MVGDWAGEPQFLSVSSLPRRWQSKRYDNTKPTKNEMSVMVLEVRLLGNEVIRARRCGHSAVGAFGKITHIWL